MAMNGSWGPADAATLEDATHGLALPEFDGVSAELAADVTAHNSRAATVKRQLRESLEGFDKAMREMQAGCEPAKYGELFKAVESVKVDRTTLMQELAALWTNRIALADRQAAEFKAMLPGAEKALADMVAKVTAELEKIGSGLAAQVAFGTNGEAAEAQLRHKATNENVHSRAARVAVGKLKSLIDAASEQRSASLAGQIRAHMFIQTVARRMLAGVV
jgi:hypothetical protein